MYSTRKYTPDRVAILLQAILLLSCKMQQASLQGTEWKLLRLGSDDVNTPEKPVTILFSEDQTRVSGFGGCNRYFGSSRVIGNTIAFSAVGSTKMYCQETTSLEDAFLKLLTEVDGFEIRGSTLLFKKGGSVVLEFTRTR